MCIQRTPYIRSVGCAETRGDYTTKPVIARLYHAFYLVITGLNNDGLDVVVVFPDSERDQVREILSTAWPL